MSAMPLPLAQLCTVNVTVQAQGVSVPTFNVGLVVGNSGVIPSVGAGSRILKVTAATWETAMINAGFNTSDPEYIAVGLYFGVDDQYPTPQNLSVGCQDPSAIASATVDAGGTGYAVGDIVGVTQSGAQAGQLRVTTVASGVVTGIAIIPGSQGTHYSVATNLPTTGGTGTGLTVNITGIGETAEQAIAACRLADPSWYVAMVCGAVDADHLAIATYAQTAQPSMCYFYGTASANVLTGATGNIFSEIKAANYGRAFGIYSTTQSGLTPNNAYIAAAAMGVAMGLNTGLAGSDFDMSAKVLSGCTPDPVTVTQQSVFMGIPGTGTGNNGNAYLNYSNSYSWLQQGVLGNGMWFDELLGLDMLAADVQISVLNARGQLPSIPQTDAGQQVILNAVSGAASRAATRGFIAGGTWNGPTILTLTAGTALPSGYKALSPAYSTQSSGDRALRKSVPVYLAVILAGSQQSFTIGVNVQQ